MTTFHVIAAISGILLTLYLATALIYPERF